MSLTIVLPITIEDKTSGRRCFSTCARLAYMWL